MYWDVGGFSPSICILHHLPSKLATNIFWLIQVQTCSRYSTPSMSQKAIILLRTKKIAVKNAQEFCHWHKQSHLAPWKSKKMEDVFLWFWPYLQGQCQFLRRLYSKNTCASFSGSLLQIFQIFQLPLRTTKLVNG